MERESEKKTKKSKNTLNIINIALWSDDTNKVCGRYNTIPEQYAGKFKVGNQSFEFFDGYHYKSDNGFKQEFPNDAQGYAIIIKHTYKKDAIGSFDYGNWRPMNFVTDKNRQVVLYDFHGKTPAKFINHQKRIIKNIIEDQTEKVIEFHKEVHRHIDTFYNISLDYKIFRRSHWLGDFLIDWENHPIYYCTEVIPFFILTHSLIKG